ncbi:MAG: hypothetical protein ABF449_12340 [Ethanoligenens sp.]
MLKEKSRELRQFFDKLFDKDIYSHSYIEICNADTIVLSANKEGLLYIADKIISLCEQDIDGSHYHLDEASMADKCEKPIIIQLKKSPW